MHPFWGVISLFQSTMTGYSREWCGLSGCRRVQAGGNRKSVLFSKSVKMLADADSEKHQHRVFWLPRAVSNQAALMKTCIWCSLEDLYTPTPRPAPPLGRTLRHQTGTPVPCSLKPRFIWPNGSTSKTKQEVPSWKFSFDANHANPQTGLSVGSRG